MNRLPLELHLVNRRLVLIPKLDIATSHIFCFTTRIRLDSDAPHLCNYGFYGQRGATENRRALVQGLGLEPRKLTCGYQIHSTNVRVVDAAHAGRGGLAPAARLSKTDALITDLPGVPLMILTADCVPVLIFHPSRSIAAAVHAGWRGAVAGILQNTVRSLSESYGAVPSELHALIGPSIGPCCYRVGADVASRVPSNLRKTLSPVGKKYNLDLWALSAGLLASSGLLPQNIHNTALCTSCRTELFYSYRAEKAHRGSNASIVAVAPQGTRQHEGTFL